MNVVTTVAINPSNNKINAISNTNLFGLLYTYVSFFSA